MTTQEFSGVLSVCGTKEVDGWAVVPDGRHLTVHVASGGVGLTVTRIVKAQIAGSQVRLHTSKEETYVVSVNDIFACAFEDTDKRATRKAGFV